MAAPAHAPGRFQRTGQRPGAAVGVRAARPPPSGRRGSGRERAAQAAQGRRRDVVPEGVGQAGHAVRQDRGEAAGPEVLPPRRGRVPLRGGLQDGGHLEGGGPDRRGPRGDRAGDGDAPGDRADPGRRGPLRGGQPAPRRLRDRALLLQGRAHPDPWHEDRPRGEVHPGPRARPRAAGPALRHREAQGGARRRRRGRLERDRVQRPDRGRRLAGRDGVPREPVEEAACRAGPGRGQGVPRLERADGRCPRDLQDAAGRALRAR